MLLIQNSLAFALAVLLFGLLSSTARRIQHSRKAQRLGCKPVRSPDKNDPFRWKILNHLRKARADRMLPVQAGLDMDTVGENPHTVTRHLPLTSLIATRDPENIKTILATHVSHWELGEIRRGVMSSYMGTGLLTNEGQAWKHSRSHVRPQCSQFSVSNLALFERHEKELLLKLVPGTDGWTGTTDLQPLFFNLTLDVVTEFFYGQSIHSQNLVAQAAIAGPGTAGPPNTDIFTACLDVATDWVAFMSVLGKWYKVAPARRFKQSRAKIFELVDWYVLKALERVKEKSATEPTHSSRFVLLNELAKVTDDKIWLRNETLGLLTAGRATSAALLSWLFFYLARQPSLYHKLRTSILEDFGTESEARHFTVLQLRASRYLKSCIYEALRLGSPAHTSVRSAKRDTTLPRGGGPEGNDPIYISKGTLVTLNIFDLHHREDIWGKDVDEFKPERWDQFDQGWEFLPFGGGPRACIGRTYPTIIDSQDLTNLNVLPRDFALNEASLVVVRLLQQFDDVKLMDYTGRILYDAAVINKCGNGVHVRLHRAESI
ncbi:MAG: hypothetical protein LQ339_008812 [Xanthoria mediterranea]|nr:MAG: hypothetical protein LQ339_008812 [Xanthoria mediterranea]